MSCELLSLSRVKARSLKCVRRLTGLMHAHVQLFAKHFKFEEQVKYLAKTRVSIAVGTPARVSKLLAEGKRKCLRSWMR